MSHHIRTKTFQALLVVLLLILAGPHLLSAQEQIDHEAIARIKVEGFQNSQVLEKAIMLSDVLGPRLAGSPAYLEASAWARDELEAMGLANAALEPWGERGLGWEIETFSLEMTQPRYLRIHSIPKAWSTSTDGVVEGMPVLVQIQSDNDFEQYRGQLEGRIVMNGQVVPKPEAQRFEAAADRWSEAELDSLTALTDPGEPRDYWEDAAGWEAFLAQRERIEDFYREEGVALVLEPSTNPLALRATGHVSYTTDPTDRVPAMFIARTEFNRLVRMLERDVEMHLAAEIATSFPQSDSLGYNVVAEIPGTDPAISDEVVMIGAHLDSWHVGTGATDNAAGSAIAMEAMRILRAIDAEPRRTIRIALWDGEEHEDFRGSMGYVRNHFGNPETMELEPAYEQLSGYFNIDNGSGRIRGIWMQGNEAVRPVFEALLEPFAYLDANHLTVANTSATDHMPFDAVGLPAFQFIQDPLDYSRRTHHTELDTADFLIEEDMQQAAVIVASLLLHVANRDELLPRKRLPEAQAASPANR